MHQLGNKPKLRLEKPLLNSWLFVNRGEAGRALVSSHRGINRNLSTVSFTHQLRRSLRTSYGRGNKISPEQVSLIRRSKSLVQISKFYSKESKHFLRIPLLNASLLTRYRTRFICAQRGSLEAVLQSCLGHTIKVTHR